MGDTIAEEESGRACGGVAGELEVGTSEAAGADRCRRGTRRSDRRMSSGNRRGWPLMEPPGHALLAFLAQPNPSPMSVASSSPAGRQAKVAGNSRRVVSGSSRSCLLPLGVFGGDCGTGMLLGDQCPI